VDNSLSWRLHVDQLSSKLNSATYIIRNLKPKKKKKNLKVIYHSYVHSIITYGLILGGNSSHSNIIFKLQKRIVRIITHSHYKASRRDLFNKFKHPSPTITIYTVTDNVCSEQSCWVFTKFRHTLPQLPPKVLPAPPIN
jgi:hypothetical protein